MLGFGEIETQRADRVGPNWLVESAEPEALSQIRGRETVLALWHRTGLEPLGAWLDALPGDRLPSGREMLRVSDVPEAVGAFCRDAATPQTPECDRLLREIHLLSGLFSEVTGRAEFELRVDPLDHDGCRLFHVDRVGYRLLCTYRGPGTEWVPPAQATDALRFQLDYQGPLDRLPRFCAGLFKGASLTAAPIVHRSPPIAGKRLHRLLVCLTADA